MAQEKYIEKLEEMIAKGVLRASWEGRSVEFDSFEQLKARIEDLESRSSKSSSHVNPTFSDGIHE